MDSTIKSVDIPYSWVSTTGVPSRMVVSKASMAQGSLEASLNFGRNGLGDPLSLELDHGRSDRHGHNGSGGDLPCPN